MAQYRRNPHPLIRIPSAEPSDSFAVSPPGAAVLRHFARMNALSA